MYVLNLPSQSVHWRADLLELGSCRSSSPPTADGSVAQCRRHCAAEQRGRCCRLRLSVEEYRREVHSATHRLP